MDSTPDLQDDNNSDALEDNEDAISSEAGEREFSDESSEHTEAPSTQKSPRRDFESHESWLESKESFFDFYYLSKKEEEVEEEEEELPDYGDYTSARYDYMRFDETLTEEKRQEIIMKLQDIQCEARVQMVINKFLHKQYINAIRNSPSLSNALDADFDEALVFEDMNYLSTLDNFEQTLAHTTKRRETLSTELETLQENYSSAKTKFTVAFDDLMTYELAVAKKIKPRNLTKEVWLEQVDKMLENQKNQMSGISKIRLNYVRLHYQLEKLRAVLSVMDSLGPGFSIMDYEMLLKRRDVYLEKRDEQCDQIDKINAKNLCLAGVVRHIDEDSEMFHVKVKKESKILNALLEENQAERFKAVELVKMTTQTFKNIMNLRNEIGLLDIPYVLKKMQFDLTELDKLKKKIENIQSMMQADEEIFEKKKPYKLNDFKNKKHR